MRTTQGSIILVLPLLLFLWWRRWKEAITFCLSTASLLPLLQLFVFTYISPFSCLVICIYPLAKGTVELHLVAFSQTEWFSSSSLTDRWKIIIKQWGAVMREGTLSVLEAGRGSPQMTWRLVQHSQCKNEDIVVLRWALSLLGNLVISFPP